MIVRLQGNQAAQTADTSEIPHACKLAGWSLSFYILSATAHIGVASDLEQRPNPMI